MGRQIVLHTAQGPAHLEETLADNEAQLQETLKAHPDLLLLEEFGLTGPMMVIGREMNLASGAADLVGLARSGDLLIVEFKTGPQNSDFRHALAQLLDYGADAWRTDPDAFETTVARRYLLSDRCPPDVPARGARSLEDAAVATWGLEGDELAQFDQRWRRCLERGEFHYVLAAQRFTATMERTVEYLNDQSKAARFYGVELVRFVGDGIQAFEARTILKPVGASRSSSSSTDEASLLKVMTPDSYRAAIGEFLEFARGQSLVCEFGSKGVSIRLRLAEVAEPISIAWIFPPGVAGWAGLRDINLGHDNWRAERDIGDPQFLADYVAAVGRVPGAEEVGSKSVRAYRIPLDVFVANRGKLMDAVSDLVQAVGSRT